MNDPTPVLEARGLGKTYVDAGGALTVLSNVDITVQAGESVAVMGASGAGKSTLLHLLGGLDAASTGEVWVDGRSLTGLGERERSRLRNQSLGFIYQFHHLLDEFTARENIAMPLLIGGMAPARAGEAADAMLDRLGLAARGHHKPGQLSGGERQRVAIGRALVTRPRCILADGRLADAD
jgi:lipoprotein-releasing system ATP-binding protein